MPRKFVLPKDKSAYLLPARKMHGIPPENHGDFLHEWCDKVRPHKQMTFYRPLAHPLLMKFQLPLRILRPLAFHGRFVFTLIDGSWIIPHYEFLKIIPQYELLPMRKKSLDCYMDEPLVDDFDTIPQILMKRERMKSSLSKYFRFLNRYQPRVWELSDVRSPKRKELPYWDDFLFNSEGYNLIEEKPCQQ